MTSRFGWIDFAQDDRQQMLDILKLFALRDTRDELGSAWHGAWAVPIAPKHANHPC